MKVIQHGVGFVGQKALQLMLQKGIEVVGAIDKDKKYAGHDLGDILGIGKNLGVEITDDISSTLKKVKADIVTDATVTFLDQLLPEFSSFLDAGLNVASISEELAYPWARYPKLAKELDDRAKKNNVTIVGTGINPGMTMDIIPLIFVGGCGNVNKIKVVRVVDASVFNPIRGAKRFGVSAAEFKKMVIQKETLLHSGFDGSMTMISDALGWKLDNILDFWEVLLSPSVRETPWYTVKPGTTCGYKQTAIGLIGGEARILFELYFMCRPNQEVDGVSPGVNIWIDGDPGLSITFKGGLTDQGTLATAARLVNIIPAVIAARPGLLSVKDIPLTPPLPNKESI